MATDATNWESLVTGAGLGELDEAATGRVLELLLATVMADGTLGNEELKRFQTYAFKLPSVKGAKSSAVDALVMNAREKLEAAADPHARQQLVVSSAKALPAAARASVYALMKAIAASDGTAPIEAALLNAFKQAASL